MPTKRQLTEENAKLAEQLGQIKELLTDAVAVAKIGSCALMEQIAPKADELKEFSKRFPMWSISLATDESGWHGNDTVIRKTFTRSINDLAPAFHEDRDTYLRFADPEYFDDGLRNVFRDTCADPTTWIDGDGSFFGKANGSFGGGEVTLGLEGETAITRLDLMRVELAEHYLQETGLFASPEAVAV